MDVFFADAGLAKACASERLMRRELGVVRARRVAARLQQLRLADTLAELRLVSSRVHELNHERAGCVALDLDGPYRLVIEPVESVAGSSGRLDWASVTAVVVIEIVDYH